jgi:hypothetical protein
MNRIRGNQIAISFVLTTGAIFNSFSTSLADEGAIICSKIVKDTPIKTIQASASVWSNFRQSSGSISYESNEIFEMAKVASTTLTPPTSLCPKGCMLNGKAELFFRSAPHKIKEDYDDKEYCQNLQRKTEKEPIRYQTVDLRTVDDLNDWIGDLSQGKGEDGADLYRRCDRSCSPRFEYTVARRGNSPDNYLVRASIICGEARDKDDNMYDLEAFFRWECNSTD